MLRFAERSADSDNNDPPMKILLGHNYYQSSAPSGEDSVFLMERELLQRAGHEVICYERHNDSIGNAAAERARVAIGATWSRESYRDLTKLISTHRPDIAHFHNTFPLISPSAYHACRQLGVPVVQTLHNYRLICPGALLLRAGKPCETCVGKSLLPAIQHGCYRQSSAATTIVAGMLAYHRARQTYEYDVDRYIALTSFARELFVRGGLPADRIAIRPNYLMDAPGIGDGKGQYALYVGRLTTEKGVNTLIRAWQGVDLPLKIAGDGALRSALQQQASETHANVEFLGFKPRQEIWSLLQRAQFLVIPSECYEGFPVTVLEAFATGTPVIASAIGALDEIVADWSNGLKFSPGNADALRATINRLRNYPDLLRAMRTNNRVRFEREYSPSLAASSLLAIYESVLKCAAHSSQQRLGTPAKHIIAVDH